MTKDSARIVVTSIQSRLPLVSRAHSPASRRSVLAAAGAALTSFDVAATEANETIDALIKLSEQSNATLMRGDIEQYQNLLSLSGDFTLMAPFGFKPTRRVDLTDERMNAMGRFFKNGTLEQEVMPPMARRTWRCWPSSNGRTSKSAGCRRSCGRCALRWCIAGTARVGY